MVPQFPKIGDENIDNQHAELFQLVTMLDEVIISQDMSKVKPIVAFLEEYVQDHFKDEENIMLEHQYGGYDLHKSEHEAFKDRVVGFRHMLDKGISNTHLIFGLRRFIDDLARHIRTIDIGISQIVKEHHEDGRIS